MKSLLSVLCALSATSWAHKNKDPACYEPLDPGPCQDNVTRYGFDYNSNYCREFMYGGCEGNSNNFEDILDCYSLCSSDKCDQYFIDGSCYGAREAYGYDPLKDACVWTDNGMCKNGFYKFDSDQECQQTCRPCSLPLETGRCDGAFRRWGYDSELRRCREFVYGGCDGNANNYESYEECQRSCSPCFLPLAGGYCDEVVATVFGFDKNVGKCREFSYTGCGGNLNRFSTSEECLNACEFALFEPGTAVSTEKPPCKPSTTPPPETGCPK